jgi:hypothetical protein
MDAKQISLTIGVTLYMISYHGLNLVFCPNSRANGIKEGWTGMLFSRIKIVTEAVRGCVEDFETV